MSGGLPAPARSPADDVSPKSQPTHKTDYFALEKKNSPVSDASTSTSSQDSAKSTPRAGTAQQAGVDLEGKGKGKEIVENTGDASATTPGETASSTGSSGPPSRKGSISSVTWAPHNPSLPQGRKKPHVAGRIRAGSPPHRR